MTISELRPWLLTRALPLWLAHGIDWAAGGFHEALAPAGYGCDADFRRLRVVSRQIYVFAQAHRAGLAGADAAVALGLEFLQRHAALPDGGYAWRFDLRNQPIDTTRDLYDHAFVLLALAAASSVLPAQALRPVAMRLLDFIDAAFPHPAGGYRDSVPETPLQAPPRRQNPHMHLFEALLACHEAFGDPVFLRRAHALHTLLLTRLLDPATGALPEEFGQTWQPIRQHGHFLIEPGHHCEWVWLLHRHAHLAGPGAGCEHAPAAARLMDFVDRHGHHAGTGDLIDAVASDGTPRAATARLWPQTEYLKAAALRADASQASVAQAGARLGTWLHPDGLWCERRDASGNFLTGPAPASSLYHLTCAIMTVA